MEYVVLFCVIAAAVTVMFKYIRRAVCANLKIGEEQINMFTVDPKPEG